MSGLLGLALALVAGLGSALVPVVNAEAYAAVGGAGRGVVALVLVVVGLAVGQTFGKVLLFEAGRRGAGRFGAGRFGRRAKRGRHRRPSERTARWTERARRWLASPRTGPAVVFAAASVGLPPLAVVSVAAGAARQGRWIFVPLCLAGRAARFAVIALSAAAVVH